MKVDYGYGNLTHLYCIATVSGIHNSEYTVHSPTQSKNLIREYKFLPYKVHFCISSLYFSTFSVWQKYLLSTKEQTWIDLTWHTGLQNITTNCVNLIRTHTTFSQRLHIIPDSAILNRTRIFHFEDDGYCTCIVPTNMLVWHSLVNHSIRWFPQTLNSCEATNLQNNL